MKIRYFIATIIALTAFSGLRAQESEEPVPYKVTVQEFDELLVEHGINVNYKCNADSAGTAVFTATPQMTSLILFSNPSGRLKIELSPEVKKNPPSGLPTVTVYSSYLTKVENRGDSVVNVLTNRPGPFMKVRLEGNGSVNVYDVHVTTLDASLGHSRGDITVTGICKDAKLGITGKGKIFAGDLKATNVKCSLFGSGEVWCWISGGELTLQGLSAATVYYKGDPVNIKKRSSGVKLEAIPE